MIATGSADRDSMVPFDEIVLPGFEASWAGPSPLGRGVCYGSDDGRVWLADEAGRLLGEPFEGSPSGEPINGVAGARGYLAVSTRQEVSVLRLDGPDLNGTSNVRLHPIGVLPYGAHGVELLPSGKFVAPLGHSGLMYFLPQAGWSEADIVEGDKDRPFPFYQALPLAGDHGVEYAICAGRREGIGIVTFQPGSSAVKLASISFENLDIVDVCSIATQAHPRAVAAVAKDGTLLLLSDILPNRTGMQAKFTEVRGTAYRVLSSKGHLFVLTSRGVCPLMNVSAGFLDYLPDSKSPSIWLEELEAVDANRVGEDFLLVVMPEGVRKFEVEDFEREAAKRSRRPEGEKPVDVLSILEERVRNVTSWKGQLENLPA